MSVRDSFSQQEWYGVMSGPSRAGLAVVAASPSGLTGVIAEANAIGAVIREMIEHVPKTPLLEAMADAYQHTPPEELREMQQLTRQNSTARNLRQVKEQAFESVRQSVWLVSSKTGPEDVRAYKELILKVAERAAGAAKEGGFLGIGGVQVSDAEKAAIEELKRVLGP